MPAEYQNPLTTYKVFSKAWEIYTSNIRSIIFLALCAIYLPLLSSKVLFAYMADIYSSKIKSLVELQIVGKSYVEVWEAFVNFFSYYALGQFLLLVTALAGYLGLIRIASAFMQSEERISSKSAFEDSFVYLFRAVLISLVILILAKLEILIFWPFNIAAMLGLMALVILVIERRGALNSFSHAIFFRYASLPTVSYLQTAIILLIAGFSMFAFNQAFASLGEFIYSLDIIFALNRSLWNMRAFALPFSLLHLIWLAIDLLARVLLFSFLPSFTVSLYFHVKPRISQRI